MPYRSIASATAGVALVGALVLTALPADLHAQARTLSWTETSTVEVPGTLGMILRAMPGTLDSRTSKVAVHLQGGALIRDDGSQTTIMDADTRQFLTLDHEARTYMAVEFEESVRAARQMLGVTSEAMAEAGQHTDEVRAELDEAREELRRAMDEARQALTFQIRSENTGRTRGFGAAGSANQHIIIAELGVAEAPEGVDDAEDGGTLVFVVELWQSRSLPTPDAFHQEWSARLAQDPQMQSLAADLAAEAEALNEAGAALLAMWDPRIAAGFGEIADAMAGIEGTTVQSVVTVAMVPHGAELDRDELLGWKPESMGDRLRAEAGGAVREAAADAARTALRGLTGRLGGRDRPQADEEPAAEKAAVRPLIRVTNTKENIVHGDTREDVLGAVRQRMEGYRQITLDDLIRDAGATRP
jgi:hypothetical protein